VTSDKDDDEKPRPPQPPVTGFEGLRPELTNFDGPGFTHPFGHLSPPPKKRVRKRDDRRR
jgi:hypothetical protein